MITNYTHNKVIEIEPHQEEVLIEFQAGEFFMKFRASFTAVQQGYLEGSLKWDGCCDFTGEDDGALHICGLKGVKQIEAILTAVYALGAEHIEKWSSAHGHSAKGTP